MAWSNLGSAHRPVVMGRNGMVASAHPLASLAGLRILRQGGNAIDAAVATAAALNVAEPYMSGLGGGGYMLIQTASGETQVLDYSGWTSSNVDIAELDLDAIDVGGKAPVIPGAPLGWLEALAQLGTMPASDVFAPAIEHAEQGVPLTIVNAKFYAMAGSRLDDAAKAIFWPSGGAPDSGSIIKQEQLAKSLRTLASEGPAVFYDGPMGREAVRAVQAVGGYLTDDDLRGYRTAWLPALRAKYRNYEIRTIGPPATAFQVPATLKLLEGFDLCASGQNSADTIHHMAEAMKLAIADRIEWAGDADAPFDGLFSDGYAESRRVLIDPSCTRPVEGERYTRPLPEGAVRPGSPEDFARENTTHFDVIDAAGNGVSVTQSLGSFFGSGVMGGDTGIMLNNFSHSL